MDECKPLPGDGEILLEDVPDGELAESQAAVRGAASVAREAGGGGDQGRAGQKMLIV
jgi:hypothetical protein